VSDIILPTNNLAFKKILANDKHTDIPIGLIYDFFGIEVKDIVINNPYSIEAFNAVLEGFEKGGFETLEKAGYFFTEVDAFCTAADNRKFSSEMQLCPKKFLGERMMYYSSTKFCENYGNLALMRNESKYSSLYPMYTINILGFNRYEDDLAIHRFVNMDIDTGIHFNEPDLTIIGVFELKKQNFDNFDRFDKYQNLLYWREFFLTGKADETAPDYIKKAADIIKTANFSKEEKRMVDVFERAEQDFIATVLYEREEGELRGELRGELKGKLEGAFNLVSRFGFSVTNAMQAQNLPDDAWDRLIEELTDNGVKYSP
jgi:predicted transposase/invertase (TIGR01784 family)